MGEPARYAGPALVATWLGVSRAALGNWLRRYDDYPEVAAVITGPKRDSMCWHHGQREDWIRWAHGKDVTVMTKLPEAADDPARE